MTWKFWIAWRTWRSARTLKVKVPAGAYKRIAQEAKDRGLSPVDWVRSTLYQALPLPPVLTILSGDVAKHNLDEAYLQLEEHDRLTGFAPPASLFAKSLPETTLPDKKDPARHPCTNLDPGKVSMYQAKVPCQGSCMAKGLEGKPCFWSAQVAKQCPAYSGRDRASFLAKLTRRPPKNTSP